MNQDNIQSICDSETWFRAIFDNVLVGFARVSLGGRFLDVNQRLCDILGYSREELMAKAFNDITHPDELQTHLGVMRQMLAGERDRYLIEKRYYRKDGSVVWVNLSVSAVRKADASLLYFVSIIEDISGRKQAEEDLRQRDERLLLASRTAELGVFEWAIQPDKVVWENDRMHEMFGHTRADGELSKAQLLERYVHPDDAAALDRDLSEGMKSGVPLRTVYRIRRKDGALRWLELAGNFGLASDGVPIRMIGVMADITERRQAEHQLRTSEQQFRILADTAPVLIWNSGTDKLCTFFNKPWLDFTGRTMEAELGNGWSEGIHPDDFKRCLEIYAKSFDAREPFKMEYRLRRHDGEYRWILDHGVPRFSPGGDFLGYIGSCIDITDRKQAEAEREQLAQEQVARAAAESANRSKDEFVAMVSHELRSPLSAMLGYARLLRFGPSDPQKVKHAVDVIERCAETQAQLIDDLLDTARIISGKLKLEVGPVDMMAVIEGAVQTIYPAADAKGITIETGVNPKVGQITGDPERLQQVVWNLLSNAIKFTPSGGHVEVRLERVDPHICLTVSDTGKGINSDFLPYVFDRFRQADASSTRRYGGLGLGLGLVKYLVELHGGTVEALSDGDGNGATFKVLLPIRAVSSTRSETKGAPVTAVVPEKGMLAGVRVLVVDDEDDARELVKTVIAQYGGDVVTARSAAEAFTLISMADENGLDVMVTDLGMPDEDGYSLLRRVREWEHAHRLYTPAVALTAFGRSEDRLRALIAGFQIYLAKPVEPGELAVVVASIANRLDRNGNGA